MTPKLSLLHAKCLSQKPLYFTWLALLLCSCGRSNNAPSFPETTVPIIATLAPAASATDVSAGAAEKIKVNQLGYLSRGEKFAIVPAVSASGFELRRADNDRPVLSGQLSEPLQWALSGEDSIQQADFSSVEEPGEYYLHVEGLDRSDTFIVDPNAFERLHDAALKSYYLNRAGIALTEKFAGRWLRPAGHPDDEVLVHKSAHTESRREGSTLASPKGWYDAGDFGKYTVNSGITLYTLMAAYEHFAAFYREREINIPESGNGVPDILDEVKWNLDWLKTMQSPEGGVYHKLSALNWPDQEMPHEDTRQRYVIGIGTGASLNFAASLAQASRIYGEFEQQFPGFAESCLEQAEAAWRWAQANPKKTFDPGEDGNDGSGPYSDRDFAGEFAWAAAELYLSSGKAEYLSAFKAHRAPVNVPGWQDTNALAYISLVFAGKNQLNATDYGVFRDALLDAAQGIYQEYRNNPYKVPMNSRDFVWGSNAVAGNKALILLQAYRETGNSQYRDASLGVLAYLLGTNPTGYSFVTGFGQRTPMHIHHRQSQADGVAEPLSGFLVGGPQSDNNSDGCDYPSRAPAKSYLDDWCSFSTNEIAINWNAPLVYLLAGVLQPITAKSD